MRNDRIALIAAFDAEYVLCIEVPLKLTNFATFLSFRMTESIKFGPEWLRNSVANVSTSASCTINSNSSSVNTEQTIISRPVLSDHRYGREEMLSLCDKSNRVPEVLTRFRRLYVGDWQMPLALQPNTDDERPLGMAANSWGTPHMRSIVPGGGIGRGTSGIMRGGSIERGRGRGRGIYHGFNRSTSSYDDESRRQTAWIDRNGNGIEDGNLSSPRRDFSRGLENWRRGIKDDEPSSVDWRSSNSAGGAPAAAGTRDGKFMARSTSWREGDPESNNANQSEQNVMAHEKNNDLPNAPPHGGMLKKHWGDEDHLPEWATESFDYGGTFDSSGAFLGSGNNHGLTVDDLKSKLDEMMTADPKGVRHLQQQQRQLHQQRQEKLIKPDMDMNKKSETEIAAATKPRVMQEDLQVKKKEIIMIQQEETIEMKNQVFHNMHNMNMNIHPGVGGMMIEKKENHTDLESGFADFVANLIDDDDPKEPETGLKPPMNHLQNLEWFYLDPQGETQGPFSPQDMTEWFKAGYFQENLMVKRTIDPTFIPLGHVLKLCGRTAPFFNNYDSLIAPSPPQAPPHAAMFSNMMFQPSQPPQPQPAPQQQQQPPPQPQPPMMPPQHMNHDWTMLSPEQQIMFMNMRSNQQQRPVVAPNETPFLKNPHAPNNPLDVRPNAHLHVANDFMHPSKTVEMDPIKHLLMQLKPEQHQQHWIGQQPPPMPVDEVANWNQPNQQPNLPKPNAVPWNNVDALPEKIIDEQSLSKQQQQQQHMLKMLPPMDAGNMRDHMTESSVAAISNQQHHHHQQLNQQDCIETKFIENKKKQKPKEDQHQVQQQQQQQLQAQQQQQQMRKEAQMQQQQQQIEKAAAKKKEKANQQTKEEKSNQPSVPAPWIQHQQSTPGNTSLAQIQKSEAQKRQVEMAAQREREIIQQQHIQQQIQQMGHKNEKQKWATPQNHVKSLDEIQNEERHQAALKAARKEALKKEIGVSNNDATIWNSSSFSSAWQGQKSWGGHEQGPPPQPQPMQAPSTSSKGFWEEPTKQANNVKPVQMLTKSQTMATINSNKKAQSVANNNNAAAAAKKPEKKRSTETVERKELKDDHNNEFTGWCNLALNSFKGDIDGELSNRNKSLVEVTTNQL